MVLTDPLGYICRKAIIIETKKDSMKVSLAEAMFGISVQNCINKKRVPIPVKVITYGPMVDRCID